MLFLDKLFANVRKDENAPAYVSGKETLSYGELWDKACALSSEIAIRASDRRPVVVIGGKEPYMPVSFIACAMYGAPYCPVDISMPQERIRDIIAATGDPLVIMADKKTPLPEGVRCLTYGELEKTVSGVKQSPAQRETVRKLLHTLESEDTMYIIFTSGSTGKPKGVEISYGALSRFTDWSVTLAEGARVFIDQAPFSFDLSVMDTYTALSMGASVYSLSKYAQEDMRTLLESLRESGADTWVSTPSFADLVLADRAFSEELMPKLERFIFCGERLTLRTVTRLYERFPKSRIINTYGPTESTVAVTCAVIKKEAAEAGEEIPIGEVRPGSGIDIADDGELIIWGDTLANGYYNDPERTDAAFYTNEEGRRCYRTGDIGYRKGNMLYYTSRKDSQIKLHGYRIELGDIENNLLRIEGVNRALVVPETDEETVKYLKAYVETESEMTSREVKASLAELLPQYMIPKRIIFTDSIPMTANGKVDRRAL